MPGSNVERKDTHSFIFSSDIQGNEEHHGVGFCFSHNRKYRNHYIQHSSHLVEMEINNHGNNLVILGVYIPHDLVHEPTRTNIWEKLIRKTNELSTNRNMIVLGDFGASLHAKKADEEQHIGNNILGKGLQFLCRKEAAAGNVTLNRRFLINLFREHDVKCMNTFFQKPNKYKATFKLVAADKETEPRTADRYAEIDFCLAHRRWANGIKNVYTDPYTNVHTDRKSVIVKPEQKTQNFRNNKN